MRFALVLLLAGVVYAAPPKASPRQIKVPLWTDGSPPLTVKDLSARLEGTASRILSVQGPTDDLVVLLVMDLTDDLAYIAPAKDALLAQIPKLSPRTFMSVLRAQDGLRVLVDPTPDRTSVSEAITNLSSMGKAGLLDTVEIAERVADSMLSKAAVRVAVLYVTDSDVQNYREDFTNPVINSSDSGDLSRRFPEVLVQEKIAKLTAAVAGRQAPLFIVHLRYRTDRLNEAYQVGLKQLAEVTGGTGIFCRSSAEIPDAIRRSMELINSHYSVTVALPERPARSFQVQLETGNGHSLTYRTRFVLKER